MDRVALEIPGRFTPDPDNDTDKLLQERGIEHERAFLKKLQESGRDVCDLSGVKEKFSVTLEAMRAGREIIYQGALQDAEFVGYSDFLVKVAGPSGFGSHHYEPWDTKLALRAKPHYLVQLACYADLLRKAQGKLPKSVHLVLGNNEKIPLRTEDYLYHYLQVRRMFVEQQTKFNTDEPPDFSGLEDFGRWTTEAERRMEALDHLCRTANIRRVQIRKLYSCGVNTMTDLAAFESGLVPGMKASTLATLRHQAQLQLQSNGLPTPKFDVIPSVDGKGLMNLPPFSSMDVYFDMEGYPLAEGGLEYLFGTTTIVNGEMTFTDWWAHNPDEERKAFEHFVDWAYGRWSADPLMHIYHYASYEKTALRRLMGKYGTREMELDALLRNEVLVDLLPLVRQSIRVGLPNYSLKSIERLYREKRHGDVSTAIDSVVFYKKWLDRRDGNDWQTSSILAEIRSYNREDCDSTYQLTEWLRKLQKEQGIPFGNNGVKAAPQSSAAQSRNNAAALAQRMMEGIPTDDSERTEIQRVRALLAQLLEFHWREAKPVFWAKYDRHKFTEEELFEDSCCLAGLKRSGSRPRISPSQRSILYDYDFDADQNTKINSRDNCFNSDDLEETVTVESIDSTVGRIIIKRSRDKPAPSECLNLILDEFVDSSAIAESIYRIAENFFNGRELPQALQDFLLRRPPRILGWNTGALIASNQELAEGTIDVISRMDNTALCIQGPPGSGKTYTAAKAIAYLLKSGKRVGVTSNSHKAIAKLLDEVAKTFEDQRAIRIVKIQSDESDFEVTNKRVYKVEPKMFFERGLSMFSLIGGTAWLFSDVRAHGLCDYLFVDEAGQVSLANLVAMSPSSKNIVLIGDQMQLAQPLKGTHPGESGNSLLTYLLRSQDVIAEDFGIFLGTSRRMHPDVCAFISGAVYQDRLHSHPDTSERVLRLSNDQHQYVKKSAGLIYVPVEHDGNTQDSEEEADVIVAIIRELQQCSLANQALVRRVESKDIMLVAPYNMQVRRLRAMLPGFQVGSVDRFQGQEAPIVIVSMSASAGDGLSRGIEFLFSKNRLNVAISRAQTLAIVVGSPLLAGTRCNSIEQMELVNLYCRILETHLSGDS
jgi:uncharacterized protein